MLRAWNIPENHLDTTQKPTERTATAQSPADNWKGFVRFVLVCYDYYRLLVEREREREREGESGGERESEGERKERSEGVRTFCQFPTPAERALHTGRAICQREDPTSCLGVEQRTPLPLASSTPLNYSPHPILLTKWPKWKIKVCDFGVFFFCITWQCLIIAETFVPYQQPFLEYTEVSEGWLPGCGWDEKQQGSTYSVVEKECPWGTQVKVTQPGTWMMRVLYTVLYSGNVNSATEVP